MLFTVCEALTTLTSQHHKSESTLSVAANINADIPLATACVADAEKLCQNLEKGTTVLACLREKKEELTADCKTEVFDRQAVAADDWRTDIELFKACEVGIDTVPFASLDDL